MLSKVLWPKGFFVYQTSSISWTLLRGCWKKARFSGFNLTPILNNPARESSRGAAMFVCIYQIS